MRPIVKQHDGFCMGPGGGSEVVFLTVEGREGIMMFCNLVEEEHSVPQVAEVGEVREVAEGRKDRV